MLAVPWLASMRTSSSASVTTTWPVIVTSPESASYSMWSAARVRSRKVMTTSPSRTSKLSFAALLVLCGDGDGRALFGRRKRHRVRILRGFLSVRRHRGHLLRAEVPQSSPVAPRDVDGLRRQRDTYEEAGRRPGISQVKIGGIGYRQHRKRFSAKPLAARHSDWSHAPLFEGIAIPGCCIRRLDQAGVADPATGKASLKPHSRMGN